MTMSLEELDESCGMLCLDLCIFLSFGDELPLEDARHVLFGRGASFGVSGCDRMRLRPRMLSIIELGQWFIERALICPCVGS